jgi:acyl-CoA reductase-like NAD-dependent aldehyde dehydrogenase
MAKQYEFYCAGGWRSSSDTLEVTNPYNDDIVGVTSFATDGDLDAAIAAAEDAFEVMRAMPSYERVNALTKLATLMEARQEDIARILSQEAGKPLRDARVESARGTFTLQIAAEEARRLEGEMIPLDLMPSSKGRFGVTRKVPIGPIAGISPFNFPLNLALHKVAPAIASGNSIVLKPPTHCPLTMLTFAEIIDEVGLP